MAVIIILIKYKSIQEFVAEFYYSKDLSNLSFFKKLVFYSIVIQK